MALHRRAGRARSAHGARRPNGWPRTATPTTSSSATSPTYLDAWEHGAPFGELFVPRADPTLALEALEDAGEPLGHGVWVLDASDFVDQDERRYSRSRTPRPGREFETVAFGPFLVVRTREPTETPEGSSRRRSAVQELSAQLGVGDAARNAHTAAEALEQLRGG